MSRMECAQFLEVISAYADGELEPAARAQAEAHLHDCPNCPRLLENVAALKNAMRHESLIYNAPGALQNRISALLEKAIDKPAVKKPAQSRTFPRLKHFAFAAAAVALIGIGAMIYWSVSTADRRHLETEAVSSHNRSLTAGHLVDFVSSDQKKVADWLSARVQFAAWVPSRPPPGFKLMGGRLDVLGDRQVATLVYTSGDHTVSVFEFPWQGKIVPVNVSTVDGLNVASWNNTGWGFVVVSDPQATSAQSMVSMFVQDSCGTGGQ
jgi:anti-sigma factor RsiW